MTLTKNLKRGLALAVAMSAIQANALRLHDIEVASYLNEPLKARIKLTKATDQQLATLVPSLGSVAAFQAAGIERTDTLADLTFSTGPNGQYLYITSDQPLREPFLLFLLRTDWDGGSATREYAMLLDLPGAGTAVAFDIPAEAEADAVRPFLANQEIIASLPTPAASTPAPQPVKSQSTANLSDIVVQSGDSLSRIARRYFDPALAPNLQAFTQALFDLNPSAFIRGDINLIRAGATLQIPGAPAPESTSAPTMVAEVPVDVQEIPIVEAPTQALALVNDQGIVDDTESQYLRQRIQELELQLANMQADQAARSEIATLVADETGVALAPLESPATTESVAIAPVAPVVAAPEPQVAADKTGPAAVAPVVATPVLPPEPTSALSTDWRLWGAGGALMALLLALFAYRRHSKPEPMTFDEPELDLEPPMFEPAPAPVAKAVPRLATQDRSEHALLLCAYGKIHEATELLQQGIDEGQDDNDYHLVQTLARITHTHDPDAFAVLLQEQTTQFPERHDLLTYLADLSGQEVVIENPSPDPVETMPEEIILGGDSSMETIEFTLELDDQKN